MPVHRTSRVRRHRRAVRLGFLLVALATAASARALDGDGEGGTGSPRRNAPVRLAADHVRSWVVGDVHYVLLEGQAAAFLGDDGLRAQRAAVRIVTAPNPSGEVTYEFEVFAEGNVRRSDDEGPPRPELRERWKTTGDVKLRAATKDQLVTLSKAPTGSALLVRAFGRETGGVAREGKVAAQPEAREPGPEPVVALPTVPEPAPTDAAVRPAAAENPAAAEKSAATEKPAATEKRPTRKSRSPRMPVQFGSASRVIDRSSSSTAPASPTAQQTRPPCPRVRSVLRRPISGRRWVHCQVRPHPPTSPAPRTEAFLHSRPIWSRSRASRPTGRPPRHEAPRHPSRRGRAPSYRARSGSRPSTAGPTSRSSGSRPPMARRSRSSEAG